MVKRFKLPMFRIPVAVYYTRESYTDETGDSDTSHAGCVFLSGDVVVMCIYEHSYQTMMHESVHAAYRACEVIDHKPSQNDQEIIAHFAGYICDECW